ncbi:MAG: L-serine ammonia-lyase, iron-sulfur-dependent, subunit alpha, partial [Clostridia bacterium]|nr:L-serine ammonia-lyase, iron-sulfur-dependent, subunit alpha [Clostridia bacterium]
MDKQLYHSFVNILKEELVPAMGCTEPIAIAFAAAVARRALGCMPEKAEICVSGNIIKNVKSVIVPHTGNLRGIEAAAAAGIVAGRAEAMLEVISEVSDEQVAQIHDYLEKTEFTVTQSESERVFEIIIKLVAGEHSALTHIVNNHTDVALVTRDGEVLYRREFTDVLEDNSGRDFMSVERIIEFAQEVDIEDIRETIQRQIDYNTAIAQAGLNGDYGANIGRVLLFSYGDTVYNRAKAWAAAGSDARMSGCELP